MNAHPGDRLTFVVGPRTATTLTFSVTPVDGRHVVEKIGGQSSQAANPAGPGEGDHRRRAQRRPQRHRRSAHRHRPRRHRARLACSVQTFSGLAQVFSLHGLATSPTRSPTAGNHHASAPRATPGQGSGQRARSSRSSGPSRSAPRPPGRTFRELLYLLAAINLFVGIVNLFPMLPLDGGHVAIAVYERIRSRKGRTYHADVAKLMPVAYVFLLFIVIVGLGALYMNIVHPAQLPGAEAAAQRKTSDRHSTGTEATEFVMAPPLGWPAMARTAVTMAERRKTRQITVGKVAGRRRRAGVGPVDDGDEDGRRRRDARPGLRARRRRGRHRALHLQRAGGGRGPGADRPPLAGADRRRRALPLRDGARGARGRRARPPAQPGQPAQARGDQARRLRGPRPRRARSASASTPARCTPSSTRGSAARRPRRSSSRLAWSSPTSRRSASTT